MGGGGLKTNSAILLGFFAVSGAWLVGHGFAHPTSLIGILPPPLLLGIYSIIGAIIAVGLAPEMSGNIMLDATLTGLGILCASVLLSGGLWIWLVTLPETSFSRIIFWLAAWFVVSFASGCLTGGLRAGE